MSENYIEAWYFLPQPSEDGKVYLNNTPNSPETEIRAGVVHTVEGPVKICERGLHANPRSLDALPYITSGMVARVRLSGEMDHYGNELCATTREYLWIADATKVLHEFACDVAEKSLNREREAGREPRPDLWRAVEMVRRCTRGEATCEELEASKELLLEIARTTTGPARTPAYQTAWMVWAVLTEGGWAVWAVANATILRRDWQAQNAKLEEMLFALHAEAGYSASRG